MNEKKWFHLYITLFYGLNILNTYFVTTQVLNRYLIPFRRTGFLELNSILGNIAALTMILMIGFILFKTRRKRVSFMLYTTLALNIAIFAIGIFTKYYQTMFSIYELTLFNNPAPELAGSIFIQALDELFTYFRIIVFLPFLVLFLVGFKHKSVYKKQETVLVYKHNRYLALMGLCVSLVVSVATQSVVKTHMDTVWPIAAERPLYSVQTAGLYNYYLGQFMGINLSDMDRTVPSLTVYKTYNKNQATYTNLFDETYSNKLHIDQAPSLTAYPALNDMYLNGIFEGKNIVVVHLESFNHFLLDETGPYLDGSYFEHLKALLQESYVLDNFYTNVGLGNSSDAEFSVMTGLYPQGDNTIYWKYRDEKYVFDALPKLFTNYYSASLHGDVGLFYNRMMVHEQMFGFDDYFYYDENESFFEDTKNGYHLFSDLNEKNTPDSPWLGDFALLDWTKRVSETSQPHFLFPITIQPHTPYMYDPFEPQFFDLNVEITTLKYLNYETYYDMFFEAFIEFTKTQENTVYFLYGDHGTGIPKDDLEVILGRELSILEYKQEMIKTLAFIYAPDDTKSHMDIPTGLLKGVQPLVRSQVDFYRTIVELFNLKTDQQYYGVNLLSDEHTFAIDTRAFDIVTDDYFILGKYLNSDLVPNETNTRYLRSNVMLEPYTLYQEVLTFKRRMDIALQMNLFQYLKK